MNVLFEESGDFKVASIKTENDSSMQVEAPTGKRSKIKKNNVLLQFDDALNGFMDAAKAEAETLEIDFLWECSGEGDFAFADLANEYYGGAATSVQATAIALKLHSAPVYFHRKGKGRYKAAPPDILKAALAGLEKKRMQAEQVAAMVASIEADTLPEAFASKLDMLLYAPDKNSLEYKALNQVAEAQKVLPSKILAKIGAIPSVHDYHLGAFLREYFPDGEGFPEADDFSLPELPLSDAQAFSIDDANTTEIDDALSVTKLANGNTQVGVHIAVPALGVLPDSALDNEAMQRLSTVYMPGHKITMLPEAAIRPFSLDAGEEKPALSLYMEVAVDWSIVRHETRLERVKVVENLRHDTLEPYFNAETLTEDTGHALWSELVFLFNFAEALEKARGKHDPNRVQPIDYNFYVTDGKVEIIDRQRGSPMDKLVAELMIAANSHWGGMIAEHDLPGMYRAKNGGKVFMTTKAEIHEGLGVAQYAWCTSPLRRAADLINQRQILAIVQEKTATYPAESKAIETHLRNFDQTYSAYGEFQTRMENYWCLQYLIQEDIKQIPATVVREHTVRLQGLPFVTKVRSVPADTKVGTHVVLEVKQVDTLLIELQARFVELLKDESNVTEA